MINLPRAPLTLLLLVPLICLPARASAQVAVSHQLVVSLIDADGAPVAGVTVRWRNEWHQAVSDSTGQCHLEIAPQVGVQDTLTLIGATPIAVSIEAGQGTTALLQEGYVRFTCNAGAPYRIEGLVITVTAQCPTVTPTITQTPTTGPSPTIGPTATPSPTPLWDEDQPLPWSVVATVEQAVLERMYDRRYPPVSLTELHRSPLWAMANSYSGMLRVWCSDPDLPWGSASNWRVTPGAPLTGEVTVETAIGAVSAMGFANLICCRVGLRYYILQWGGYALAMVEPGCAWEVIE